MTTYNCALLVTFFTLFQISASQTKTTFSFNDFSRGGVYVKLILMSFFSMAGVPPFVGFFAKVLLFILLSGSNFAILFPFFFYVLFIGLYFYVQNIRFLNASNSSNFQPLFELGVRVVPLFFSTVYLVTFFLIFGAYYLEDLVLISK